MHRATAVRVGSRRWRVGGPAGSAGEAEDDGGLEAESPELTTEG